MKHVRIIDQLGGRRINDAIGRTHNLCGADYTNEDVRARDFRACWADSPERWDCCPACAAKLHLSVAEKEAPHS